MSDFPPPPDLIQKMSDHGHGPTKDDINQYSVSFGHLAAYHKGFKQFAIGSYIYSV